MFKIKGEFGIGSGLRRIEAFTSLEAYRAFSEDSRLVQSLMKETKSTREEFTTRIMGLFDENKNLRKEIEKMKSGSAKNIVEDLIKNAITIRGIKFIYGDLGGLGAKELRESAEYIKSKLNEVVAVIYSVSDNKTSVVSTVSKTLTSKVNSNEIMKLISMEAGTKGGGTADFAQGGGGDISKIRSMEKKIETLIIDKIGE